MIRPSSMLLLLSGLMLGFFAGCLLTMHLGITDYHDRHQHDQLFHCDQNIEPIVKDQKVGKYFFLCDFVSGSQSKSK